MTRDWVWIGTRFALAAHRAQIEAHGGGDGLRVMRLLESALARPKHLASYAEPDAAELAAAYAFGLARNHPFVDGNKRTALVVSITFLRLNGHPTNFDIAEATAAFWDLAAGELSEAALAAWFRDRLA